MNLFDDKVRLYNYIIQNEDIPISDDSLFNFELLAKLAKAISSENRKELLKWNLTSNQLDFLVNYFCSNFTKFDKDTPQLFKDNEKCILNVASKDIGFLNELSVTKSNRNIIDNLVELALNNNYIISFKSPSFFKRNFKVAFNSIKINPSSASYAAIDFMKDEERKEIIDYLLTLDKRYAYNIYDTRYLIECHKKGWITRIDIMDDAEKDKELFDYIEKKGIKIDKSIFDFNVDVIATSKNLEKIVKKAVDYYTKSHEEEPRYLEDYIPQICKLIRMGFSEPLTIKKLKDFFGRSLEEEWELYINKEPFPKNIANKIIATLKLSDNPDEYLPLIECYLDILRTRLTHNEYKELLSSIYGFSNNYYYNVYFKTNADIIFQSEKIFLEREKEKYINDRYYEIFGPLLIPKKDMYKYHECNERRKKFREVARNRLAMIRGEVCDKYGLDYNDIWNISDSISSLEKCIYDKDNYDETISLEEEHKMYLREKRLFKIIRWLNSGKIDINDKTIAPYLNYIREESGEYFDRCLNKELPNKDKWEAKEKLYKIYKEIVEEAYYASMEDTWEDISSVLDDYIPRDIPLDDDHFIINARTPMYLFISSLYDVSKSDLEEFFDNLDKYEEFFKRTGALHFILANQSKSYFKGHKKDCSCNTYMNFFISSLIKNSNYKDYSKAKDLYELYSIVNPMQFMTIESSYLLGEDCFHRVVNIKMESTFDDASNHAFMYLTEKKYSSIPFVKGTFENYKYESIAFSNGDFIKSSVEHNLSPDTMLSETSLKSPSIAVIKICDSYDNYIGMAIAERKGCGITFKNFSTAYSENEPIELQDIFKLITHIGYDMADKSESSKEDKHPISMVRVDIDSSDFREVEDLELEEDYDSYIYTMGDLGTSYPNIKQSDKLYKRERREPYTSSYNEAKEDIRRITTMQYLDTEEEVPTSFDDTSKYLVGENWFIAYDEESKTISNITVYEKDVDALKECKKHISLFKKNKYRVLK